MVAPRAHLLARHECLGEADTVAAGLAAVGVPASCVANAATRRGRSWPRSYDEPDHRPPTTSRLEYPSLAAPAGPVSYPRTVIDSAHATRAVTKGKGYHRDSALKAEAQLTALATELDRNRPGAAGSLRERMAETLTEL